MKFNLHATAASCVLLVGCSAPSQQEYYFQFVNKTGRDLHGVSLFYGDKEATAAGELVKSGRASDGPVRLPIPPEAEVRWEENGGHHAATAKLQGVVPQGSSDFTLNFIINEDGSVQAKVSKD